MGTVKRAVWQDPIAVGDRVFCGNTCPATGLVVRLSKNGRWAWVAFEQQGVPEKPQRRPMAELLEVTASLSKYVHWSRGGRPCARAGCCHAAEPKRRVCWTCGSYESEGRGPRFKPRPRTGSA